MRRSKWAALPLVIAFAMVIAACGVEEDPEEEPVAEPEEEEPEPEEDVEESVGHPDPSELDEQVIRIATGGTGGTYYPLGGVLATMLTEELPNVTSTAEVTGATSENLRLLQGYESELILGHTDSVSPALQGIGDFEGEQMDNLRAIGIVFVSYGQVASRADQACIETLDDLLGSRWAVGEPGSATEIVARNMIEGLGYSYDDLAATPQLGYADMTAGLRDGQIDAGLFNGTIMMAALEELTASFEICMLQLTAEQMDQIRDDPATAHIANGVVPAGTYPGQDEDWGFVPSAINTYTVLDEFDRSYAYYITKIMHDEVERLISTHPSAADTTIEQLLALNTMVPLHSGAIDYILEEGWTLDDIPEAIIPPEYEPLS